MTLIGSKCANEGIKSDFSLSMNIIMSPSGSNLFSGSLMVTEKWLMHVTGRALMTSYNPHLQGPLSSPAARVPATSDRSCFLRYHAFSGFHVFSHLLEYQNTSNLSTPLYEGASCSKETSSRNLLTQDRNHIYSPSFCNTQHSTCRGEFLKKKNNKKVCWLNCKLSVLAS